jgi:hypothetical protein
MLIVEDNTGREDADSYQSVAEFRAYCVAYGLAIPEGKEDADVEVSLRKGTQYVDTNWTYKGEVLNPPAQALEFPRRDLSDGRGRVFNTVPPKVKQACGQAAHADLSGEALYTNVDRGGAIVSESVGPISVSYAAGAPTQRVFSAVAALLKPYARDAEKPRRPTPFFSPTDATPAFAIGMHDDVGADDGEV